MEALTRFSVALAALATACTVTTTTDLPPPTTAGVASSAIGLSLSFARGNGLVVQVQVEVTARGLSADLGDGDVLTLRDGSGSSRVLESDSRPQGGEYEAEIDTNDVSLVVELSRNGALDRNLPIALPPNFTLTPASLSRAADVTVTWDAAPAFPMTITASGAPCLPDAGFTASFATDTGTASVQSADFLPSAVSCGVTFVATRGEGVTQVRTVVLATTP